MLYLNETDLMELQARIDTLSKQGVQASEEHSGEMNFSGCASGYCQAWD